ncbi:MAG: ATP-grasp domain-containing protein [Halobacteriota archaeon]
MDILLAEYATVMTPNLAEEGQAILHTLKEGFQIHGHSVHIPQPHKGDVNAFYTEVEELTSVSDAGLVIAPDKVLYEFTSLVEQHTMNLGCPAETVKQAADKLAASEVLLLGSLTVPEINPAKGPYITKPRHGCGAEGIRIKEVLDPDDLDENTLVSKFVSGDHVSVSLIVGKTILPLSINKQHISINSTIRYLGNTTPYSVPNSSEVIDQASRAAQLLGCKGYVGVDIVLQPDGTVNIVDVNPRPTTAIVSIDKVIGNVADLILKARLGKKMPALVKPHGIHTFMRTNCGSTNPL